MNNKGFTLIEVLSVVVILGIISTIISVSVFKMQKDNEIKSYEATYENIKSNLELYNTDKKSEIWKSSDTIFVSSLELFKINPSLEIDNKCEIENLSITRNLYGDDLYNYKYSVCIKCGDDYVSSDCK